jgi:predicted chitinase
MNRTAFYAALRGGAMFPKGFKASQVEGTEAILDEAEKRGMPLRHLAYILATAFHESAHTMQAVRETLAKTDDGAINALEKSWKAGKLSWVKTPYWRKDGDGKSWFGRGLVQITHKSNYQKLGLLIGVDLVKDPSKALELPTAVQILITGMELGSFTDKSLADYITDKRADYEGARRIVNGTDRAALIAGYAVAFEKALKAASYSPKPAPSACIAPSL